MTIEEIKSKLWEEKYNQRHQYIESFNSSLVGDADSIQHTDVDLYARKNYWHLTSSKFKCFLNCKTEYYLKYELLLPEPFQTEGKHFTLWRAFDELRTLTLELWQEEWTRQFMDNYYIELKALKAEYVERLIQQGHEPSAVLWLKVDELKELYYQSVNHKNKLTYNDWNKLMFMMKETEKNRNALDTFWEYTHQKFFSYDYMVWDIAIKIAGTLDRWRQDTIRDWKTTSRLEQIMWTIRHRPTSLYEELEKVIDDYWYYVQLWFYDMLTLNDNPQAENVMFLDFISTQAPFSSYSLRINTKKVKEIVESTIKPWLAIFARCLETWDWSDIDFPSSKYYCYSLEVRDEEPLDIW